MVQCGARQDAGVLLREAHEEPYYTEKSGVWNSTQIGTSEITMYHAVWFNNFAKEQILSKKWSSPLRGVLYITHVLYDNYFVLCDNYYHV